MALPAKISSLAEAFRKRRTAPARLLSGVIIIASLIGAGFLARFGTLPTRIAAALLIVACVVQLVAQALRDRRDFNDTRRTIRRVLVPVDRALGERALRAAALAERAERDPTVGSLELSRLHFERMLSRASLTAIEEQGERRARGLRTAAAALVVLTAAVALYAPSRVLEGLDVLVARHGRAPMPMAWLDLMRITVQPPGYLHAADRPVFPGFGSAEPQGSQIVVRGVPVANGRRLVLSDGANEVPFVDDGAGGVVARYTLRSTAELTVGARFGQVLIPEAEGVTLESVPDAAPQVDLEDAPGRIELRDFDRKELRYEASDDHGLRQIDLVLRAGGREDRRPLLRLDGEVKLERGAYAIESSDSFLRRSFLPVEVSIEARDDDALSGVKWGKSAALTLLPVPVGEGEAARYRALLSARDQLTDLLASELAPASGTSEAEQRKDDASRTHAVAAALHAALEQRFAGLRLSGGLKAFLGGQARVLERALSTPASAMRRTEDVLLAVDAALRGLGTRDAQTVSKRLGDAAEEVADGAKQALETEQRAQGLHRIEQALGVLDPGAANLVVLGPLGRDIGSLAQGEIRRIRRAQAQSSLLATELAARHLAARLRRPNPSFSTAGGGGVESGTGKQPGDDAQPSDADKKFDELVGELERLADEHQQELDRVERNLADSEKSVDLDDLKQEAAERARALREKLARLPQFSDDPDSARASAALGREHAEAMAQSLSRLALKDAVDSGRHSKSELDEADKKQKSNASGFGFLDDAALEDARAELDRDLDWAEKSLSRAQKSASDKAQPSLQESSGRERGLAERAGNLAGRGNHGEIALPEELAESLGKAEGMMRDAAKELGAGHGEQGLALQRDAQRLLEQSNSGQTGQGQDESKDQPEPKSPHDRDGKGKRMRTDADVPKADAANRADDFRRRVLEGLGKEKGGRLSEAVRRYAEGLLR